MSSVQEDGKWAAVACRLAITTICHPIEYGKTLIQLGHEPISPFITKTLFGKQAHALPGIFQYVRHIRQVDGLSGCYRGVGLRLCALTVQSFTHTATLEALEGQPEANDDANSGHKSTNELTTSEEKWRRFKKSTINELTARVVATIASQPLHVCVVRCMAQFVGRETKYNGIISCIHETYTRDGILGFFSGLVPRLMAEVFQLLIASTLTYFVNKYLISDEDQHHYTVVGMNSSNPNSPTLSIEKESDKLKMVYEATHLAGQFIASTITYPLLVVSNCMIVTNSGLVAGSPPNMPLYDSWRNCFWHLYSKGQLKRGSSLLWRYVS